MNEVQQIALFLYVFFNVFSLFLFVFFSFVARNMWRNTWSGFLKSRSLSLSIRFGNTANKQQQQIITFISIYGAVAHFVAFRSQIDSLILAQHLRKHERANSSIVRGNQAFS